MRSELERCAIAASDFPYLFRPLAGIASGVPLAYFAHNCEADLAFVWSSGYRGAWARSLIARRILGAERRACTRSQAVVVASENDLSSMQKRYGPIPGRRIVIPNGVDCRAIVPATDSEKAELKAQLGIQGPMAIFLASGKWWPNIQAAQFICRDLARAASGISFCVVGSVGDDLAQADPSFPNATAATRSVHRTGLRRCPGFPPNVFLTGWANEGLKRDLLRAADVALNPMSEGSGTNLKMLEFMAAGLATVTTSFGGRGLNLVDGREARIVALEEFGGVVRELCADPVQRRALGDSGRKKVESFHDWRILAERLGMELQASLTNPEGSMA